MLRKVRNPNTFYPRHSKNPSSHRKPSTSKPCILNPKLGAKPVSSTLNHNPQTLKPLKAYPISFTSLARLSKRVRQVRLLPITDQTCTGVCFLVMSYLPVYLSMSLPIYLSTYLSIYPSIYLPIYLSISLSLSQSLSLSLSLCLSI